LIALVGVALGLVFGVTGVMALVSLLPADFPRVDSIHVTAAVDSDWRALHVEPVRIETNHHEAAGSRIVEEVRRYKPRRGTAGD